jgi:phage-related tail fiber protein
MSDVADYKASVRVATLANIVLTGLQTVDGVAVTNGQRVLVKNQTLSQNNGIYQARTGAWSRAADADANSEVSSGMTVSAVEGSQAFTQWIMTTPDPVILGTTPLVFTKVQNDISYTHTQAVASSTWTIAHGLGKLPSVMVLDASDNEVFADLHYTSTSQLEVLFASPQTGKAILN